MTTALDVGRDGQVTFTVMSGRSGRGAVSLAEFLEEDDGLLPVREREPRARIAKRTYFVRLALASRFARSRKKVVPGSAPETTREVGHRATQHSD